MPGVLSRFKVLISVSDQVPLLSRQVYRLHLYYRTLFGMVIGLIPSAGLVASKALGASPEEIAMISAAPLVGLIISSLWSVRIERADPVKFLFWPLIIAGMIFIAIVFCTTSVSFVVSYLVFWLVHSITLPAHTAMMRSCYPQPVRASVLSFITSRSFFVAVIFALLSSWLLDKNSSLYRVLYPAAGVALIVGALFARKIPIKDHLKMNNTRHSISPMKAMYSIVRHDRDFTKYMILVFIFGSANLMMGPVLVLYLVKLGVNYGQGMGALGIIPWIGIALVSPLWGGFVDRYNPMLTRGVLQFAFAAVPFLYFLSRDIALVYIGACLTGIVMAGLYLTWHLGLTYFSPRQFVSRYMGFHMFLAGVRALIASFVGVWLYLLIYAKGVFLSCCSMMIVSAVLMFRMGLKRRRENVDYDDTPDRPE